MQKLTKLGYQGPSAIQAYSWPSILRGRDTVGISAPGTGKSLAFLLPLIAQTMQPTTYSSLPPGNGVSRNDSIESYFYCVCGVVAERFRAIEHQIQVLMPSHRSVGSNPGRDTCVLEQDTLL